MSILVTGGAGYIGSHMVLELVENGENVVVLDNLSTGFRQNIADGAKLVVGDIADQNTVIETIRAHNVEAIIHFAGSIIVPESLDNPLDYYRNNTINSRTLIEAATKCGVKNFIFSSTAAVYGMAEKSPAFEDAPLAPISPYGSSKMMTEIMLRDTCTAHDFNFVALRYFNVAGADPDGRTGQSSPDATHLIKLANLAALGQRSHLDVYGTDYPTRDGTCIRDYIHVSDLVNAHSKALKYLRTGGKSQIINCGYGKGYSVLEVIDSVMKISSVDFEVRMVDRRAGDPAELVAGTKRIHEILDWKPRYDDLDLIVSHALKWEEKLSRN